ncbi:hypothetical protein ACOMHN_015868 [Nucella lapillus]
MMFVSSIVMKKACSLYSSLHRTIHSAEEFGGVEGCTSGTQIEDGVNQGKTSLRIHQGREDVLVLGKESLEPHSDLDRDLVNQIEELEGVGEWLSLRPKEQSSNLDPLMTQALAPDDQCKVLGHVKVATGFPKLHTIYLEQLPGDRIHCTLSRPQD